MGLTKSVHPYCKLAIITMQMMPKISCPQRVASEAAARDEIACVVLIVTASSLPPRHPFAALSSFQIPPGLPVPRKARHSIELSMFASVTTFDPQEFNQWRLTAMA